MSAATPPPAAAGGQDRVRTDVAIVGAGIAGLYASLRLPDHLDVLIVDKGVPGADSGSSPWAQGGMSAALGPDDAPERHAVDTLRAGDGLGDPAAVDVLAREVPTHVEALIALGAEFDRDGGELSLALEGGSSVPRSVRRADATGAELVRVLRAAVASPEPDPRRDRLVRLAGTAWALTTDPDTGRITGLWVLAEGHPVRVEARAVLLATGGCGGLYAATTNPAHATGDGLALAATAGAAIRDAEFVQFHPTGLSPLTRGASEPPLTRGASEPPLTRGASERAAGGSWRFLLTEALRGAGATLHDAAGERFLIGRHPDAELAPRHVVADAILGLADGVAWLDATHLSEQRLATEFPTVLAGARRHGHDLATQRVPVTPAAHYQIGGVRTDLHARTSLPGLYAAGELASTGVHGANRLAGNSLAESLVFAARAAASITGELPERHGRLGPPPATRMRPEHGATAPLDDERDLAALREALRAAMLAGAGPVRSADGLAALAEHLRGFAEKLGEPAAHPDAIELHHAVIAARLIVRGAWLRTESRGGHRRADHPETEPSWGRVHLEQRGPVP